MKLSFFVLFLATANAAQMFGQSAIPRLGDGKPDLNGIWQVMNTANFDIQDHIANKESPAGQSVVDGNDIPYQSWALEKKKKNYEQRAANDPVNKCFLPGVPRINYSGLPFQIFQSAAADKLTLLYEYSFGNRYIYTNGTKHPKGPLEWWLGDSRGHWEGDSLVVDTVHFNDESWFDHAGDFHSEALHVTERYTLTDADHIDYHATIEDPKVFTKPWTMTMVLYRHKEKNFQLLEYVCNGFDVEKDYPLTSERHP